MSLSLEEIETVVKDYEKETKALKEELYRICWHMRGTSLIESYLLTFEDREIIGKIIEKNLEVTKESGLPFF